MKTTHIVIAVGVAIVAVALWFGRIAWRAHRDLVTLHVRNAPLAEVVRQVESQTREKLRVNKKLDAKITLDVKNMPLPKALDLISAQAGARWSKVHAVYGSPSALGRLDSCLYGESRLDEAGWTNIAPQFDKLALPPGLKRLLPGSGSGFVAGSGFSGGGGFGQVRRSEDIEKEVIGGKEKDGVTVSRNPDGSVMVIKRGPGSASSSGADNASVVQLRPDSAQAGGAQASSPRAPRMMTQRVMVRKGAGGTTTTLTTKDGDGITRTYTTSPDGEVQDMWSSERLILETALTARLADAIPKKASRETAAQAADKVGGKWATYYALEAAPLGWMPDSSMPQARFERGQRGHILTNGEFGGMLDQMSAEGSKDKLKTFGQSPEEQVQRARQRETSK